MGRYRGPVCRMCRREGVKLFLKGIRCSMAKCPVDREKPPPGVHGSKRGRKMSDYALQLREKQKLKRQFGMREEQFRAFFAKALKKRGITGEHLLQMLESRLDNLVYRLGFAPSRQTARQMVLHGHINLNGKKVNIPSVIVKAGSVISVVNKPKSREMVKRHMETIKDFKIPGWLSRDDQEFSGQYLRIPTRDEISPIVNEQLIVELYSK